MMERLGRLLDFKRVTKTENRKWLDDNRNRNYCDIKPFMRIEIFERTYGELSRYVESMESRGVDYTKADMPYEDYCALIRYCNIIGEQITRLPACLNYRCDNESMNKEMRLMKVLRDQISHDLAYGCPPTEVYKVVKYIILDPKYYNAVSIYFSNIRSVKRDSFPDPLIKKNSDF